jgi:hypothetical protein
MVARIVSPASLDAARRREMLGLMHLCYEGVSAARFESDLEQKQYVILLFRRGSRDLVGFSTLRIAVESLAGRTVDVAFSGDTVIHPDHWGAKTLQMAFGSFLLRRMLLRPWRPCFWLLLSGGYRTYLLMANHFPQSYPTRRHPASAARKRLLDDLATRWFGSQYDSERGIVRFAGGHYRVRRAVAALDASTARHPDVAFFVERNPGHAAGDELVCLAELRVRDLIRALLYFVMKQLGMSGRTLPEHTPVEARS